MREYSMSMMLHVCPCTGTDAYACVRVSMRVYQISRETGGGGGGGGSGGVEAVEESSEASHPSIDQQQQPGNTMP